MSESKQQSRLARIGNIARIASYLVAGSIGLYTIRNFLPDWLFLLGQAAIAALVIATFWAVLASSARLRQLIFRERRRIESEERRKQDLRDEFRVFVFSVKSRIDCNLWEILQNILRQGQGTEAYQAMVYGSFARTSTILGGIYGNFDPTTVSSDLLTHYKSKLDKIAYHSQHVLQYAPQVKSSGETFSKLISDLDAALRELHTDMEKKAQPKTF